MSKSNKRARPLAPTDALDLALAALSQNDPEGCLRRAVPALTDVGAGAAALDVVGRAAVALGNMHLARMAFSTAARALAIQGQSSHAIASAVAVLRLSGGDESALRELAAVFSSDAMRAGSDLSVAPPPLSSTPVEALSQGVTRQELMNEARKLVEAAREAQPESLPVRRRHALWASLTGDEFVRFARTLEVRLVPPGATVLREGERGSSVYVVARGEVRIARARPSLKIVDAAVKERHPLPDELDELAVLGAEAVLGEMALLTAAPRAASALSTRATLLLEAEREALEAAVAESPALGEVLLAWGRRRLVENLLRTAPLLKAVPSSERGPLAEAFETRVFAAGETLFTQDTEAAGLFLLASGEVEVHRQEGDANLVVGRIGAGGCVGEISVVLRRPTNATVIALEATVALVLRPDHFLTVVRGHPTLLASLYELAVSREEELLDVLAAPSEEADDLIML
ncbi:MAG: cyclic nucleotide-binding domain-containing protein [Myxococcales bacterium]|nr:cyclic nucleotide-binding domain-containing protein [Myxococcales bacterium]